jgi:hypothetical protein
MARRLNLTVDDRTDGMSDEALVCRSFGHRWTLRAISRSRFQELISQGLTEYVRYCENGCGSTWRQVWDVRSGDVVENDRRYPSRGEYLAPVGQGRVRRPQARIASFARQYPGYV